MKDLTDSYTRIQGVQLVILRTLLDSDLDRLPPPPTGERWRTLAEYGAEYRNAATTAARRQQLLAIQARFLPRESVPLDPLP